MNAKDGFLGLIVLLLAANLVATVWSNMGAAAGDESAVHALPLPKVVSAELKEDLLKEFIDHFNDGDFDDIYDMLGPAARAQVNAKVLQKRFAKLADLLDAIEGGAYSHSLQVGTQGSTRIYQLYYGLQLSEDSQLGPEGTLQITLAIEGEDYQIYDLSLQVGAYTSV